jgi:hypothetical protein
VGSEPRMEQSVYRFRSTLALLDNYHELENQEIYFASLPELNDPLEGFKDLFWKADVIAWRNFLRHYLLCLMRAVLVVLELGPDYRLTAEGLSILNTEEELPTAQRETFHAICAKFFGDGELADLPALLAARDSPIRRSELLSLLWPVHFRVLKLVFTTLSPSQPLHPIDEFFRARQEDQLRLRQSFAELNRLDKVHKDSGDITEQVASRVVSAITQTIFIREYTGASQAHGAAWNAIASSFPELYLNALEQLLYFDWYTACFVADPTQAAMWGNYGDGHRGVCLKFKTSSLASGKPTLALRHIVGLFGAASGISPVYDFRPLELHEVQYRDRYSEIDFFRSLGRLSHPQLAFWFTGANGAISATGLELLQETKDWRHAYWESFDNAITTKLTDWRHEREYRITLHSTTANLSDPGSRKLRYRFNDLEGIIFGMKTSTQDKLSIVRIIQDKCKQEGRKHFEIHQTYYSRRTGRIATTPWDLLKLG